MPDAARLQAAHRRACTIGTARDAELRRAIVARVLFDLRAGLTDAPCRGERAAEPAPPAQAVGGRPYFDQETR